VSQFTQFGYINVVNSLTGDVGGAIVPVAHNIDILGGTNINTAGTPGTITINLDDTITLTQVNATTFDTNVVAAGVTLSGTTLAADGTDANIDINITPKGTGVLATTELTLVTALEVQYGGTGAITFADNGILYGNAAAAIDATAELADGELLIGSTGNPPVPAALTQGTGVAITTGAGSIEIDVAGGGIDWNVEAASPVNLVADNGYIANTAGLLTFTLPAAADVGSTFRITGLGAGGWTIAQNAGQNINYSSQTTTPGVGGSLSSTQQYDSIHLVCTVANTEFNVLSSVGNFTIV